MVIFALHVYPYGIASNRVLYGIVKKVPYNREQRRLIRGDQWCVGTRVHFDAKSASDWVALEVAHQLLNELNRIEHTEGIFTHASNHPTEIKETFHLSLEPVTFTY
jgi:hypothetical protein